MTESLAIIPRTIEECTDLATKLAASTLIPQAMRDRMPNVLVTILAGQEMGLAPMAALRSIHVIEGKPVISADGMVAVVMGSGKAEYFDRVEESDTAVTYETKRVGRPAKRCTWTIEMAKRAALHTKDNWRCYPRAMLAARAKAELARDVYPDVLAGVFTHDEVAGGGGAFDLDRSIGGPLHHDAVDAEIVSETPVEAHRALPWWVVDIDAAPSEELLKAMAPKLAELKSDDKAEAKKRYGARLVWLRENASKTPPVASTSSDAEIVSDVSAPAPEPAS